MATVKRIALLMGQDIGYCRGVLRGIHAYAVDKTNWLCRDAAPDMKMLGPCGNGNLMESSPTSSMQPSRVACWR